MTRLVKLIIFGFVLVAGLSVATPAGAHHVVAQGTAACGPAGTWTATWTVADSHDSTMRLSDLSQTVSPTEVAPGTSATGTTSGLPLSTTSVTLSGTATFGYYVDGIFDQIEVSSFSVTVTAPECPVTPGGEVVSQPTGPPVCIDVNGVQIVDLNGDGAECVTVTPPNVAPVGPTPPAGEQAEATGAVTPAAVPAAAVAAPTTLAFTGSEPATLVVVASALAAVGGALLVLRRRLSLG